MVSSHPRILIPCLFIGSNFLQHCLTGKGWFKYHTSVRTTHFKSSTSSSACPDDKVRPQTSEEKELYKLLSEVTQRPATLLSSRWREPSLTIHSVEISGPKSKMMVFLLDDSMLTSSIDATVIPGTVKAQISLRIVPDQDLDTIVNSLREHLRISFDGLQSPNNLVVSLKFYALCWSLLTRPRSMLNILLIGGLAISMTIGSSHWKVLFGRNGVKNLFEFAKEG